MVLPIGFLDISPVALGIIGALAVLLFGEKLPDVARSFGKKFADFRKNVQSIQDEIRSAAMSVTSEVTSALDVNTNPTTASDAATSNGSSEKRRSTRTSDEDYEGATAPKFVPPKPAPSASAPKDNVASV